MRKVWLVVILLSALGSAAEARVGKKCYIKPCVIKGDFDGDGKIDRAILIEDGDGKRGVQVKIATGKSFVIGAGIAVGSGGANFDWMNHWEIHHGAIQQGVDEGKPPEVKGDSLLLEQTNSASGIVYWNGSGFEWYQQGD